MKFTGILASLAVASTATAAALPNLDVVKIQSTITHLDDVLGTVEGVAKSADMGATPDFSTVKTELTDIHGTLNGLVGKVVNTVVGTVESTGLVEGVLDLAGGLITTVVNVLGSSERISDFSVLSDTLLNRIQSGEIDAAGLQNLLAVLGGNTGLENLNTLLSKAE
ncbi:hypothetical protein BJX61DRAFT_546986 [Aspergillus egyptiacus]|nr:hypothetical protein BJX61DRAFT_546986 [Aspergillus egyptiacus]